MTTTKPFMIMIRDQGGLDHAALNEEEGKKHFQRFVDWATDLEKRGLLVAVDPSARNEKSAPSPEELGPLTFERTMEVTSGRRASGDTRAARRPSIA